MLVITGAAGFIGSCVLARFNALGREDIVIVDHLDDDLKKKNLENKKYLEFFDKEKFLEIILNDKLASNVDVIIHMGACSSTTLQDAQYFEKNNFEYSRELARWCISNNVRLIYASSAATYGDGSKGYSDDEKEIPQLEPLNLYGQSKQKFDMWVLDQKATDKFVGLKFFNVFGPNEYHKGDMRSVIAKTYQRVKEEGKISLFKSYRKEYRHGEQKRDFIYIKDAVDVVIFFYNNLKHSGIFNVGTGKSRSWNDLADALFSAVDRKTNIEYIEMPESLKDQYQYFTEADMNKLRNIGYKKPFTELKTAIQDYAGYLKDNAYI